MKQLLTFILIFALYIPAGAQQKKRGKVKRKYRKAEKVEVVEAPPVFLRGKIRDADDNLLPGAHVTVQGTKKSVHANEDGEYFFYGLETGIKRIQVSFAGYRTKSVDFYLQAKNNFLNFTLDEDKIHIDGISVTAQKRDQQLLDVPITMSSIDSRFLKGNDITGLGQLSKFVPGFQVMTQGDDNPSFVVRGLSSKGGAVAQPRVSVFYNNVPINRASGAVLELFDMQELEVLKGPQNTLFGKNALIGAIHYISNKPTSKFYGDITAGVGDYNQRKINGAINIPVMKEKLMVRAAWAYDYNDGYIKNTCGGRLNGENTVAGRFSVRFVPTFRHKIDLVLNYQKDDAPGLGFMSMDYPNTEGSTNPFDYTASLEQGKNLAAQKDVFDVTLTMKQFNNENNYWTSTTSWHTIGAYSRQDGDGTAAAAIDMSEDVSARQFYQELRYNYSRNNRLNGSLGASLRMEEVSKDYWFSTNEQDMYNLIFGTGMLVDGNGNPLPVSALPADTVLGSLAGLALPENHQEEYFSNEQNRELEGFLDFDYQLTKRISITVGARGRYEREKLSARAQMAGGNASTLGNLTGNFPNLLFAEGGEEEIKTSSLSLAYRAALKYALSENANVFVTYSKGRSPKVLLFDHEGEKQVTDPEVVDNYELGFKTSVKQRAWFDVGFFYQECSNLQTSEWIAEGDSGKFYYIIKDDGKGTVYGTEASLKVAVLKGLLFFGNYAYTHARFDNLDVNDREQEYAGNTFRLSPENSFALGLHARAQIAPQLFLFANPAYSWRSKIYFDDSNTSRLEQAAYGTFDFRGGVELPGRGITIAVYGTNLLGEEYIVSAGNTGGLFGSPTQIPGAPRMIGTKLTWDFKVKKKPYYKRSRWNR